MYFLFENWMYVICKNLNPLQPRMLCTKFRWNWLAPCFWRKLLNIVNYFRYFVIISPLKKAWPIIRTNLNSLHNWIELNWIDALCQISFKLTRWFWRRRLFNLSMCFFYFFIISPWKRSGIIFEQTWIRLHPRMLCAMFHWNKSSNSGEKDFEISSISLLPNYLPLKKEYALHLNKFESPLPKDALCKACL